MARPEAMATLVDLGSRRLKSQASRQNALAQHYWRALLIVSRDHQASRAVVMQVHEVGEPFTFFPQHAPFQMINWNQEIHPTAERRGLELRGD